MSLDPLLADCVDFARRIIRVPSMSGDEAAVAGLIAAELAATGFDEVWTDAAGNVCGRVRGREPDAGAIVLNSHLDIVDPGDPSLWPVPPYDAAVVDGHVVGRGAADIKGPLAVQVYALTGLRRAGERPRRDVVFCAVTDEEVGGAGALHWAREVDYPVGLVVLGEPSSNEIALGHRGIAQLWLTFHGRSAHASAPERARNPNGALGRFLERLPGAIAALRVHPVLGETTVTPTIVEVDTRSPNVTPAWTRVLLDCRTGVESYRSLTALLHDLAGDWPHSVGDAWGDTPLTPPPDTADPIAGFYTPPDSDAVVRARRAVGGATGREPALTRYAFATDGRHLTGLGAPIIGYSPADEDQAHVAGERISIARMAESLLGHMALLREF